MDLRQLLGRPAIEEVDAGEAHRLSANGSLLVDVRETFEFDAGHAPRAALIPLGQLSQRLRELPQDRDILFICRSGNRSALATEIAGRAGLKARNVRGGMLAWARAGLPIEG